MNKIKILEQIVKEQSKTLANLTASIQKYKSASDMDEDDTLDPEDYSHQGEAREMKIRMEQLLLKESKNLELIEKCLSIENEEVAFGALLDLDSKYLFVGVSIHPFSFEGKEVYSISTEAPIFQLIKGKKVNELIELGTNSYTIKSIK
ncbi:hypothetical protein [Flavobacterium sp.]|uniref:hypothetical protein n=1 Tax=Flavobacterium sp. TaxID=239 RepID=UPI0025C3E746|nr:hypothetical protein [Flavobacterium sp.]